MEVKSRIIDFMEIHNIDVNEVSEKTGIRADKFLKINDTELDADEFCRLCVYLKVRPEDFYSRKIISKD